MIAEAVGARLPWWAAGLLGAVLHLPLLLVTFERSNEQPEDALPVSLAEVPPELRRKKEEPPPRPKVPERVKTLKPNPMAPKTKPPKVADDISFAKDGDSEPPPPTNTKEPPPPSEEAIPVVTGLKLSSVVKGVAGVHVRVGNTYTPGFERDDVDEKDIKAYAGGVAGGRAGRSGGMGRPGSGRRGGGRGWRPAPTAGLTTHATVKKRFRPRYPRALVQKGIEGEVQLLVEVTREGKTRKVTVLEGATPELDRIAVASVKRFVWEPAMQDGKPVDSVVRHTFRFELYQ